MSRAVLQNVDLCWVIFFYLASTPGCRSADADSCHEVKTAYMMRQIGPVELVPDSPQTDDSLRVCVHSGLGCCTSKMEDGYMAAVRSETQQKIRSFSFELKYLIAGHSKAYQDTFDSLVSFTSNLTSNLFDSAYSSLASECRPHVLQLFNDIRGHLSGEPEPSLELAVGTFFNELFPLVYGRLLNPGMGQPSPPSFSAQEECLRMTRQDVSPFGPHPPFLLASLSRALRAGRTLSRLLRSAGDVVDATEKATLSRECGRGLVRMRYCSHCRGLTLIRPCSGLCVNVMRGCLVGISELAAPWRSLVLLLQRLAATLATSSNHNSMELALLAVRNHVDDAILHAQLHGPRITAIVEKVCGSHAAGPVMISGHPNTSHVSKATGRMMQRASKRTPLTSLGFPSLQLQTQRSFPLKGSRGDKSRSLKKLSREFEGSIQRYQLFFSELPAMLCESETEVEQHTCWSGRDVVEREKPHHDFDHQASLAVDIPHIVVPPQVYAGRVVASTLKAQRDNPEISVRNTDPVLRAAKHRLERLTQELLAELGRAHQTARKGEEEDGGSAQTEKERASGDDCDDEDGCEASGMDPYDFPSGRSPVREDRAGLPPPQHIPPHLDSPPLVAVRGSASAPTVERLHLSLAAVPLLLSQLQSR
ncbi:glypican-5-like isoform X1 [Syngnathus acus]|uniref:glypican-5-like isoform X1 n=1 Tax=Syngnathus acus TaxID=161584 RepID=UPI0018862858|nr:glypican-5-like isoform X1 [Syngnathus acus]XP_037106458.1 glypican-5-like isoform X1 [Syngnathus acus]XP_037106461.1 glypican-5-like isoform X1 [Syngnathus acus]XP_037106462.1 glypican-5-like isoform X1 [Syngnathus acus]